MTDQIIIYGNIASGKSSVCRHLEALLEGYTHVCLDAYRVKLWNEQPEMGRGQRDLLAQAQCLEAIRGPVIYETTAVTRFFKKALAQIKADGVDPIYIHLDCRPSTCIRRYKDRLASGHIQAPFAWGNYTIEQSIYYFYDRQLELRPQIRINTMRVRPEDAARAIAQWMWDK